MPQHKRRRLKDIKINAIAFVDAGANKRNFAVFKNLKKGEDEMDDELFINDTQETENKEVESTQTVEKKETDNKTDNKTENKIEKLRHGAILARIKSAIAGADAEALKKADIEAWIKMLQSIIPFAKKLEEEGGAITDEISEDIVKGLTAIELSMEKVEDAAIIKSVVGMFSNNPNAQIIESGIQVLKTIKVEKEDDKSSPFKNGDVKKAYNELFKALDSFENEAEEQDKETIEKANRKISLANEGHALSAFKAFVGMIKNMLGEPGLEKAKDILNAGPKDKLKDDVKKILLEDKSLTAEEADVTAGLILAEQGV